MKIKIYAALLFCAVAVYGKAVAQVISVDSAVIAKYNSSVTRQVYEVVGKTSISAAKQKQAAAYFQKQDSTIAAMVKQKKRKNEIDSVRKLLKASFMGLLTAQERFNYTHGSSKSRVIQFPLLSAALKLKDSISLSNAQADSLSLKIESIKSTAPTSAQVRAMESEYAAKILNANQFDKLLKLKNKDDAKKQADKRWATLEKKNLAAGYSKEPTIAELKEYYLKQKIAKDKYAYNKALQKQAVSTIAVPQSLKLIKKVSTESDSTKKGKATGSQQFSLAIKNRSQLSLSQAQVDSLLKAGDAMSSARQSHAATDSVHSFNKKVFEGAVLKRIFSQTQYQQFLQLKNRSNAQKLAERKWEALKQKGLDANYDKTLSIQQMAEYYYTRQSISDQYAGDKVALKQNLAVVNNSKPAIITKINSLSRIPDSSDGNTHFATSQLKVAIDNKNEIGLSTVQFDSLTSAVTAIKLEQKRHKENDTLTPFNKKGYESAVLKRILNESQYNHVLELKNRERANQLARVRWAEMVQLGIAANFVQANVIQEIANFYFARQCTTDKLAYDNTQQKIMLKQINAGKPMSLKALEHIKRNPGNTTIGQGFQW